MSRIVLILLLALMPLGAHAKPAPVEARQLVHQANRDYKLGRFDAALAAYARAYELAPAPAILFNIAQCHRNLGQHDRAVFFFEGYLRERPGARNRELARSLLAESRAALEEEQRRAEAARPRPPLRTELSPDLFPERRNPWLIPPPMPLVERRRPITSKWWFWTALGVGAAAATVTTVMLTTGDGARLPAGSAGTLDRR